MLSRLAPTWRLAAGAIRVGTRAPHAHTICAFSTASDTGDSQWNDFNTVVKELRRIAQEEGIEGALPDTKLLKELGHKDLVLAIRKKHGGFVSVASKIGFSVDKEHVEIQKKITSRANRRKKRGMRISKHEFY